VGHMPIGPVVYWRLSFHGVKLCIFNTTVGTGKMHEVCERHRSVTRFMQKGSEFFLTL
jgi:hypothetical protein